ncbi:acyltransferase [Flavobacterium anhuiense]|uniref:acyltransferase n=1 Tax=Flavobacterium anhuiense TaxID=459526 RepID=UPI003D994E67
MTKIYDFLKSLVNNNKHLFFLKMKFYHLKNKYRKQIIGKNNLIINDGVLLNVRYDIIGNNNRIEIMSKSLLSNLTIYMRGDNHKLKIDEECIVKGGEIWFEDSFCEINIGKKTTIESAHFAVTEIQSSIFVGEDCMFSNEIELRTGDSHAIIDLIKNVKINKAQNIIVGNHVWIGSGAKILKGVCVGNNSIIGTGSIVTKNIPNNSIAAGVPSKIVKTDITWERDRFYN